MRKKLGGANLREGAYQNFDSRGGGANPRDGAEPNKYGMFQESMCHLLCLSAIKVDILS